MTHPRPAATRDDAHPLLEARTRTAQALDEAIAALGVAMAAFAEATDDRRDGHRGHRPDALSRNRAGGAAGGGRVRPLPGAEAPGGPVSLRDVVERQHLRMVAPLLGR